jgi:hypothetical protein
MWALGRQYIFELKLPGGEYKEDMKERKMKKGKKEQGHTAHCFINGANTLSWLKCNQGKCKKK